VQIGNEAVWLTVLVIDSICDGDGFVRDNDTDCDQTVDRDCVWVKVSVWVADSVRDIDATLMTVCDAPVKDDVRDGEGVGVSHDGVKSFDNDNVCLGGVRVADTRWSVCVGQILAEEVCER
jgi:hypothetical protein